MKLVSVLLSVLLSGATLARDADPPKPTAHTKREVEGWTVQIDDRLLKAPDAELTNAERVQRNAVTSMAGVLAHVASDKIMRQLESAVQAEGTKELPIGRTLELFRGKAA